MAARTQEPKGTGFKRIQVERGIRQIGPNKWEVQVHVGRDPLSKKLRQKSRTTSGGIRAARKLRAELISEVANDKAKASEVADNRTVEASTFGHLLDEWLALGRSRGRSPSTIDGYEKKISSTIRPELGAIPLEELTAKTLDAFYGRLIDEGTSPATLMHHHRIISAALAQAVKWDAVTFNAAQRASPPPVPPVSFHVPPPDRVRALIELAAASRSPEWATVITLAALTGLRRGELCGLQWGDVDWKEENIAVRRSVWQTKDGWGIKEPKTHQTRQLEIGTDTVEILAERYRRVTDAAALAEVPISDEAFMFSPDIDGARPMLPGSVTLAFGRLCKKLAETTETAWPYRFHDLRHYTATELFRAGHHARTVADRLGHADPSLTLRVYTHDTQDQARSAAESLEVGILAPRDRL
jgi:integrase